MSENRMRYVIAYDIEDDRLRNRLAKTLRSVGFRVQQSVFECLLDTRDLARLEQRLGRLLDGRSGVDVRVYRVCASCFAASFGIGDFKEGTGGEPWVVM